MFLGWHVEGGQSENWVAAWMLALSTGAHILTASRTQTHTYTVSLSMPLCAALQDLVVCELTTCLLWIYHLNTILFSPFPILCAWCLYSLCSCGRMTFDHCLWMSKISFKCAGPPNVLLRWEIPSSLELYKTTKWKLYKISEVFWSHVISPETEWRSGSHSHFTLSQLEGYGFEPLGRLCFSSLWSFHVLPVPVCVFFVHFSFFIEVQRKSGGRQF